MPILKYWHMKNVSLNTYLVCCETTWRWFFFFSERIWKKKLWVIFLAMVLHRCHALVEVYLFFFSISLYLFRLFVDSFVSTFAIHSFVCSFTFEFVLSFHHYRWTSTLFSLTLLREIGKCKCARTITLNRALSVIFMSTILYYHLGVLAKLVRFF